MKFNISKDWILRNAKLEDGCSVEAGRPPNFLPNPRTRIGWKWRCARRLRKLLKLSWWQSWEHAGSLFEAANHDLTESPEDWAECEHDQWQQDADPTLL